MVQSFSVNCLFKLTLKIKNCSQQFENFITWNMN
jgi:hypothetical protein